MFRDSMPPVLAAASELSAMQNSILLLCDQVQELRGKLNASRSRPSSSQKSKLDELTRAKRELARVREENEALAMRCRQLSMMQSPQKLSDVQASK
jgi:ribosomal protein L29